MKISVGLDIGTTKVVVMVGRKDEDGRDRIIGVGESPSLGVVKGVILNISQTIEAIRKAVAMAEESAGVKIKDVVVGIAGQHIRSQMQTDYITREDPDKVIEQQDIDLLIERVYNAPMPIGEKIIHVLPQEYRVNSTGGITQPVGMSGSRLEANFLVVIGQISAILNIARCVKSAGLNLEAIKLQPLASAESVLTDEEKEAGVILMDIGGGTTDIAIFRDHIIRHTAVVPYGGRVITNDIKDACGILGKYAEKLKVEFGSTWPGENKDTDIVTIPVLAGMAPKEISMKDLSRVIHARMNGILDEVNVEIANYRKIEPGSNLIGGIVVTGAGARLKHLPQLVMFKTGMHCRVGFPEIEAAEGLGVDVADPSYATCIGLVISGLKDPHEVSLEEEEKEQEQIKLPTLEEIEVEKPIDQVLIPPAEDDSKQEEDNFDEDEDPVEDDPEQESRPKRNFLQSIENALNRFISKIE